MGRGWGRGCAREPGEKRGGVVCVWGGGGCVCMCVWGVDGTLVAPTGKSSRPGDIHSPVASWYVTMITAAAARRSLALRG